MKDTSVMPSVLSVADFCEAYHLSRSTFYNLVKAGELPVRKAGRRTLIATADADAWFARLPSSASRAVA